MKIVAVAAAFAGAAQAFNFKDFVEKAQSEIYQKTPNGFKVSFEPFLSMDCTVKEQKEFNAQGEEVVTSYEQRCDGTSGIKEGSKNSFKRYVKWDGKKKTVKVQSEDEGNTANVWFNKHLLPEKYLDTDFDVQETIKAYYPLTFEDAELFYLRKGNFGDMKNMKVQNTLKVNKAAFEQGMANGNLLISGQVKLPENLDPAINWLNLQTNKWWIKVNVNAAMSCVSDPYAEDCTFGGDVKGKINKKNLPRYGAQYVVEAPDQFALQINTLKGKNMNTVARKVLRVYFQQPAIRINWDTDLPKSQKAELLLAQIPNSEQFIPIQMAAIALAQPFKDYITKTVTADFSTAAHAVVWVDQRFKAMSNEFDCSALVEATMLESELISQKVLNNVSVQDYVKGKCVEANDIAVGFLKTTAADKIEEVRSQVNDLTGPTGEAEYMVWFKKNFPERAALLV